MLSARAHIRTDLRLVSYECVRSTSVVPTQTDGGGTSVVPSHAHTPARAPARTHARMTPARTHTRPHVRAMRSAVGAQTQTQTQTHSNPQW